MKRLDEFKTAFIEWKKRMNTTRLLRWKEQDAWAKWMIGGMLLVALVLMFPRARSLQFADMKEGSISTRRIVAPFDFEILKTREEYQGDREIARRQVFPLFRSEEEQVNDVLAQIDRFFRDVLDLRRVVLGDSSMLFPMRDSLFLNYEIRMLDPSSQLRFVDPRRGLSDQDLRRLQSDAKRILRDVMGVGILDLEKESMDTPDRRLILLENDEEVIHPVGEFYDFSEARSRIGELLRDRYQNESDLSNSGFALINYFIRPNLIYEKEIHQQRVDDVMSRVPLSSGFVYENEKIVDRNERITPEIRKKLVSLATTMEEKGMREGGIRRFFPILGKIGFILMVFLVMGAFIVFDRPSMIKETKLVLLAALIILFVSLITFFIHQLEASEYLVPAALGAMLLTAIFDARFGYVSAAVIGLLVGGLFGNSFSLMSVSIFVGVVGVMTIRRIRGRRQLIQAIFYLGCATIFAITAMGLIRFLPFRSIIRDWPYGALTALVTPVMTYGLLPLVESTFGITTDFSLLELSNLNHPLLTRLSVEAPGTYHHSIIVGNLAEAASQAIGANSLLARVGSYYHDIGKIEKSEYFVENQFRGENPHEKLTPRMSALILMNHVKRGLELAEKYKLPKSVREIIGQHQGTTVMSFFHQKALNQKNGGSEVSEVDYRYPGPRPQTKEAAIVMLADTVDAAARTLKEPTHSRLKGLIEELVDGRFQEGQLDESPLTLRDLERIKESFLLILAGTFHARVEYPEKEEKQV